MFASASVFLVFLVAAISAMPRVLYEGDVCNLGNDRKGLCRLLSKCKPVYERLQRSREKPVRCSFQKSEEVVCCDDEVSLSLRKSELACREYSNEIPVRVNPFITGGGDAEAGDFPHMAALGYVDPEDPNKILWRCGGTLISDKYILTAAHCVVNTTRRKPPVEVMLGAVNLINPDFMAEKYHVKKIITHPTYSIATSYDDIALIELDRTVRFSDNVQPACLYTKDSIPNAGLKITGWGSTSNSRSAMSDILQQATLSLVPNNKCDTFYRTVKKVDRGIQDIMFCASDPEGIQDTCNGDSGGPLQVLTPESNIYFIVGVTSVGPTICGGETPAIYTRVSKYIDWVEKTVWG